MYSADLSGDNSVSHALEYYVADNALSLLAKELGKEACKNLLGQIEGEEVPEKTLLSYEVVMKESTQ